MASTVHHELPIHTQIKLNLLLAKFLERRRRESVMCILHYQSQKFLFELQSRALYHQEILYCKRPFDDVLGPDSVIQGTVLVVSLALL
jgi:hypothetical protein